MQRDVSIMLTLFISCFNVGTDSMKGGHSFIDKCLKSNSFRGPTILTDDGSEDDTFDYLFPWPSHLIKHRHNWGLRDSWREAISICDTPYLLRTDADILFPIDPWWNRIIDHMDNHPKCGAVGLTQTVQGGIHSAGDIFTNKYRHIPKPIANDHYRVCPSVMGCFVCHRIAALKDAGGLNADTWLRSETEDLHLRMWKRGWQVHCLPIEFEHCHYLLAKPRVGKYNCAEQEQWISDWMWDKHRVDWTGSKGGTVEDRWKRYHDRGPA